MLLLVMLELDALRQTTSDVSEECMRLITYRIYERVNSSCKYFTAIYLQQQAPAAALSAKVSSSAAVSI